MTMTGDWTVVNDDGAAVNENNNNNNNSNSNLETFVPSPTPNRPSITMPESTQAAVRFPCSEQPPRFALRARNGFYLGGTKRGRLVGRKKRTENDDWTIAFAAAGAANSADNSSDQASSENTNSQEGRPVTLHNHKFGSILSLVNDNKSDLGRIAACITPPNQEDGKGTKNENNGDDLGLQEENGGAGAAQASPEKLPGDEEDGEEDDDDLVLPTTVGDKEDLQWTIVPCSGADHPNGGVTLVSLKTGDRLGVTDRGKTILCASGAPVPAMISYVWELKCVTGELCFLSNPSLDARIRCDMAGLLTLSPNWKGWEVVRIVEASSAPHSNSIDKEQHGYVRISSWMHSQWFLCSDATGTVGTCSVAESLAPAPASKELARENNYRCALWAIEKYPSDENSKHEGVVLRSVTHGRLLSIRDGLLRTYGTGGESNASESSNTNQIVAAVTPSSNSNGTTTTTDVADPNLGLPDALKQHTDEMMRKAEEMKRNSQQWWRNSLTSVQKSIGEAAMNRRGSKLLDHFGNNNNDNTPPATPTMAGDAPPEEETIVWQLEAAHLQTYYFVSAELSSNNTDPDAVKGVPRSIGAFPSVTNNLRKSDKIQFVRSDLDPDSLKLYLPEEQYFVRCGASGTISATKQEEDEGTEWILEDRPGGSVFQSRQHGLYLTFRDVVEDQANANNNNAENNNNNGKKMKDAIENLQKMLPNQKKKIPMAELFATASLNEATAWKLEPCTPRAISSKRLKTFAIGTSIAVGTTIAMPFALAGVAAAMGALGAEAGIGFGIVAAGLSGAEALASVGAIGATAYFCFRPEQNSLGGPSANDQKDSGSVTPWSKRPFSNWRNW